MTREINTKVVGVTFENDDGSDRQHLIGKCKPGDLLILLHDTENKHDSCAVAVYHERRSFGFKKIAQIGYLGQHLGADIVAHMESGGEAYAIIKEITGGEWGENCGVNIVVCSESPK